MAEDERESEEPAQKTPKGHEIPVPTRKQVFRDLEKVAKAPKRPRGRAARPEPERPAEPS
jgi:hypothetical protein